MTEIVNQEDKTQKDGYEDVEPVDTSDEDIGTEIETGRWLGVGSLALFSLALAIFIENSPFTLLAGAVPIVYAAYARSFVAPEPKLELERSIGDTEPEPGEEVEVKVTVKNVGDSLLPDLRLIDGVPPALEVVDGIPRKGTSLRSGKKVSFTYTVEVKRGTHIFQPMTVVARDISGAKERRIELGRQVKMKCPIPPGESEEAPLRSQTSRFVGNVPTNVGGSGVEFHETREYRPGDPMKRIDWNRHARTGELATLEFREERAATVLLLVDTRDQAYRAREDDDKNAVEYSIEAAVKLFTTLIRDGNRVGISSFGPEWCWIAPGAGHEHASVVRETLGTGTAFPPVPTGGNFLPNIHLYNLRKRMSDDTQIIFFSPVCDDYVVEVIRKLDAYGHATTLISPDVTGTNTPGQRLASIERKMRLSRLRKAQLRVVDWDTRKPIDSTLEIAARRWAR